MDGLVRWNADRASEAIAADAPEYRFTAATCSTLLTCWDSMCSANPSTPPSALPRSTLDLEELIRVEYLYDQTNVVLGKYSRDAAEGDKLDGDDEAYQEDEAGLDPTIPPLDEASGATPKNGATNSKYKEKSKGQEQVVLEMGISLPRPPQTSAARGATVGKNVSDRL
ncbi:uncharacterized protein LOC110980153 [Acanthaster planci]|uniref:Uncharacterized protein LOC110980153 n=1 Tax=Acanthaster planci TaxID=133434 RepID=A0A8B7YG53_ACAPL|nr:uncharacterized protein LOC110980153 [Acanthaster planci]